MTAPVFPSIEQLLVARFTLLMPDVEHTAELPHNFQDADGPTGMLPVIVFEKVSGANLDSSPYIDRPVIDVDSYASTRSEAQRNAERVRHALCFVLPGSVFQGAVFTRTRTIVGPRELPHANKAVRRYSGNYELLVHPQP